jgi:hypothetical protein
MRRTRERIRPGTRMRSARCKTAGRRVKPSLTPQLRTPTTARGPPRQPTSSYRGPRRIGRTLGGDSARSGPETIRDWTVGRFFRRKSPPNVGVRRAHRAQAVRCSRIAAFEAWQRVVDETACFSESAPSLYGSWEARRAVPGRNWFRQECWQPALSSVPDYAPTPQKHARRNLACGAPFRVLP